MCCCTNNTVGEERFLVGRDMVGSEGVIKSPILGGEQTMLYGDFEGFTPYSALFGMVT